MIYLPPPQPVPNKDIRISGDVEIHPTASIAPGVILQAAPDKRIVIGADACIGMGVIINASKGSIEIGSGAILGSGVLIIGACKVGNNACVGTAVTIFQANVEAMKTIEPGAVLGDDSRKVNLDKSIQENEASNSSPFSQPKPTSKSKIGSNGYYSPNQTNKAAKKNISSKVETPPTPSRETTVIPKTEKKKNPVVGQVYINELLVTLFPHNKDLNSKTNKLGQ